MGVLHDTVCQLITLVWFCKRVGIPFDVYLFTNDWTQCRVQHDNYEPEHYDQVENAFHIPKYFSMVNILTSKVRSSELDSQIKNLYRISYYFGSSYGVSYQIPDQAGLSGTPLNEAVISLNQIIPEFQKKNGVQKVNCVILTDGEACSSKKCKTVTRRSRFDLNDAYTTMIHASIPGGSYIRDRQTGHTHSTEGLSYFGDITAACLRQLKTRFGNSNFIGIRLISGSSELSSFLNRHVEYPKSIECRKIWKKEKSFSIKTDTYDRCIAISTTTLRNDSTFYVNPDASKAQIKSAFKKSLNSKKLNKKVLTDFIEVIS